MAFDINEKRNNLLANKERLDAVMDQSLSIKVGQANPISWVDEKIGYSTMINKVDALHRAILLYDS